MQILLDYHQYTCKALLDCGAQSNFLSQSLARRLNLHSETFPCTIQGIGTTDSFERVSITILPLQSQTPMDISCHILDNLPISISPCEELRGTAVDNRLKDLKLADPTFFQGGLVDLILGASIFWPALLEGRIKSDNQFPTLQNTSFGWIVGGSRNCEPVSLSTTLSFTTFVKQSNIETYLEKFWELEDCSLTNNKDYTNPCESLFSETTYRADDGRFVVQLPLKESPTNLGDSRKLALKRLFALERKLSQNEKLRTMYIEFMKEYLSLNHMSLVTPGKEYEEPAYYIPHLGVLNESSLTTKLRVVFNASAKTSSNKSLNDILHVGPTIQDTLFEILLRFRAYPVVITADITKMYRQTWIDPSQRNLQRILWRENPRESIKTYTLNTVTYGTGPAPFLAIRALVEVANQCEESFPLASKHLKKSYYVDDFLGGGDHPDEVMELKRQMENALSPYGLYLRKYASNNPTVFAHEPAHSEPFYFNDSDSMRTLGVGWKPTTDKFFFTVVITDQKNHASKRIILSETSKLFDPLGLLSPLIIRAKMIMQKIWLLKLNWDDKVPKEIYTEWSQLQTDLQALNTLTIPRHLNIFPDRTIIFHGFADASMTAYGACIYVSVFNSVQSDTQLICSKSRVAPTKSKTQTIPRLELAAALLLSKLMVKVEVSLQQRPSRIFLWSDSSIALYWINDLPSRWHVFVANRVAKIQEYTRGLHAKWGHVSTDQNPADLISRGVTVEHLKQSSLWWKGPNFIASPESEWPTPAVVVPLMKEIPEARKEIKLCIGLHKVPSVIQTLLLKLSSLKKILRILSYVFRFIRKVPKLKEIRAKLKTKSRPSEKCADTNKRIKRLFQLIVKPSTEDLESALKVCVRGVQTEAFGEEKIYLSRKNGTLPHSSNVQSLHPFLDAEQILRVGGRLQNSLLSFDEKHPMLLPPKHRLTQLLFQEEHRKLRHAPPLQLLSSVRQRFWPINGPTVAKKTVNNCLRCTISHPRTCTQVMAPLPSTRVIPQKPFTIIGVDYSGPFLVRISSRKNVPHAKMYVAIYICFVTKAIHLEVVSDLLTASFLDAFKRFSSRRGTPSQVFSDNGKTFVGAKNVFSQYFESMSEDPDVCNYLSENGIVWKFNPVSSPHHGGLWERAVRSFKLHLQKASKSRALHEKEFITLIVQIEAILNSRPLVPLSSSPDDFEALTPGHFLIGKALTSIPIKVSSAVPPQSENLRQAYKRLEKTYEGFWQRWSHEYLQQLQLTPKWHTKTRNLEVGSLVVIKEKFVPPLCWKLARVTKVHKGRDGSVRVITLRTPTGMSTRGVTEVCILPLGEEHH